MDRDFVIVVIATAGGIGVMLAAARMRFRGWRSLLFLGMSQLSLGMGSISKATLSGGLPVSATRWVCIISATVALEMAVRWMWIEHKEAAEERRRSGR